LHVHPSKGEVLAPPGDTFVRPLHAELDRTFERHPGMAAELDHSLMIASKRWPILLVDASLVMRFGSASCR
jgi:hypothetical protein